MLADFSSEITNSGDFLLGIMAADLGNYYSDHPGYIGDYITQQLRGGGLPTDERKLEVRYARGQHRWGQASTAGGRA